MQLIAEKRGAKYYVKFYGLEHEVVLPKEEKVKPVVKKKSKKE